jgi:tetratricopeptide (TPR) repeat protein
MKAVFFLILLFSTLSSHKQTTRTEHLQQPTPEAISFSGRPLYTKPAEPSALLKSDSIIKTIKNKINLTEDDIVEIGKQLVATNRYKLAVTNYSEGLSKYPSSFKLLRNRGHRYITLRQLDNALADLLKAEKLIPTSNDEMEYGLDGKPTATVRHQIYYHIGVYHYLKKNFTKSAAAFEKALATAGDSKNTVGATDWLYNCYQRLGQSEKAKKIVEPITPNYLEEKDQAYFRRILLYKGLITPEELVDSHLLPDKMTVQDVTKLYGLASWYRYQGNEEKAISLYKIILQSDAWPGFAYAAAEKEMLK